MCKESEKGKFIGGKVEPELYWQFKQAYTQRKETATEALSNAIHLYLEVESIKEGGEQNG